MLDILGDPARRLRGRLEAGGLKSDETIDETVKFLVKDLGKL